MHRDRKVSFIRKGLICCYCSDKVSGKFWLYEKNKCIFVLLKFHFRHNRLKQEQKHQIISGVSEMRSDYRRLCMTCYKTIWSHAFIGYCPLVALENGGFLRTHARRKSFSFFHHYLSLFLISDIIRLNVSMIGGVIDEEGVSKLPI